MPPLSSRKSIRTEDQPALDAMDLDQPTVTGNVTIGGKRTSLRMRASEWSGLVEIARREGRQVSDIVNVVNARRGDAALTAALRVFMVSYFRTLSVALNETTPLAGPILMPKRSAGQLPR